MRPRPDSPAPGLSAVSTSVRPARIAGARPKSRALAPAIANVTRSARASSSISSGVGTSRPDDGENARSRAMPPAAKKAPAAPPASARTRLSVSSIRTSRQRPAPMARRTPISRVRALARPSVRLATLPQAMHRSTNVSVPRKPRSSGV